MAVARLSYTPSTATTFSDSTNSSTASVSETFDSGSTGSDRCLVVWVSTMRGSGSFSYVDVTSGTYNGVSADSITFVRDSDGANGCIDATMLVFKNPATGSNTLALTFNSGNSHHSYVVMCQMYTGVDQTTPVDGSDTDEQETVTNLNALTVTTTAADGYIVAGVATNFYSGTFTADGSASEIDQVDTGNGSGQDQVSILVDYAAATATSYSDSASFTSSRDLDGVMIALKAAGGTSETPLHYYRMMRS